MVLRYRQLRLKKPKQWFDFKGSLFCEIIAIIERCGVPLPLAGREQIGLSEVVKVLG